MVAFLIATLPACFKSEPVNNDEAKTLAAGIEKSVKNDNPDVFDNLFDRSSLRKNIAKSNPDISSGDLNDLVSPTTLNQFGGQLLAAIKGGTYKLLRMYDDSGIKHLVFRMYGDGGLNYHDFTLVKTHGEVKAADMYSFLTGEQISATFANLMTLNTVKSNDNTAKSNFFVKIMAYKNKGEFKNEIDVFNSLDSADRHNKTLQLVYIDACKHIGNDEYKKALEDYEALYPNEPNAYLLMLDVYYLNAEYDKALMAVNKLDTLVKGDPVLNLFRGNIYKQMFKAAESKASFEKCFAYDPYIKNNMQQLAASYADDKEYDKAKAVIARYKQNPQFMEQDIEPIYTLYPVLKDK